MDLTPEQTEAVRNWIQEGKSLADVQRLLQEQHTVNLTYMEVRFLVDDLNVELASEPEPEPEAPAQENVEPMGGNNGVDEPEVVDSGGAGKVSVDVDSITRPGAVISGSVTFSDGVTAQWQLDQMGRLGLSGTREGYRPSDEDIQAFQMELQSALQSKGL